MKKLDSLTVIGSVLCTIIILGFIAVQGNLIMLLNIKALIITIVGSFSLMLITYSKEEIKNLKVLFKEAFKESEHNKETIIILFEKISKLTRREGILALDKELYKIEDKFLKKGMQFVVDAMSANEIEDILKAEIQNVDKRHKGFLNMIKTWATYAQAFGLLGTIIGIMSAISNITDVKMLTNSIEVSLISTFYGMVLSCLILNPITLRLKNKNTNEIEIKEMIVDGVLAVQEGLNITMLQEKLYIYMSSKEKEQYLILKRDENINE